jgi:hypothetical protein
MQGLYAREIAVEVSTHFLWRLLETEGDNPAFVTRLLGEDLVASPDLAKIRQRMEAILEGTTLEDADTRLKLFAEASYDDLKANPDPLLQLALDAEPQVLLNEQHSKALAGEMLLVAPLYIEALRDFLKSRNQLMAPDANSTLRVTFGEVGGYEKREGDTLKRVPAFTNLRQLVEDEHQPGKKDFELTPRWLSAYEGAKSKGYGPYGERFYGDLPLNYLANLDTTGGNSGSAALNARGELVGLLFDGNTDSLYGDYVFDANVRSILVDIRYALWVLDEIEGLTELLEEMGITPSLSASK